MNVNYQPKRTWRERRISIGDYGTREGNETTAKEPNNVEVSIRTKIVHMYLVSNPRECLGYW